MSSTAPNLSEEAIALDFAERHADELRFVATWGWFIWSDSCWKPDRSRQVFTLARAMCREVANNANASRKRVSIASARTRAAVVALAGEDTRLKATVEQWDADPWLLNTPDGVVDLRTGKLRAHRRDDYMTKCCAVSPGGKCPVWLKFLAQITDGDVGLQKYLQRIAGYCLTGVTTEQELFFLYGSGCNGKGVYVQTLAGIMANYHKASSIETFTVSRNDRHPTELAALVGARLVTASETEENRRWAQARIKELTGGDTITARYMRQDFFEYTPAFKLLFSGNHVPSLRSVNKAITRRFNRIPFTVTIAPGEVNQSLVEELKSEWRGILRWMVEGCLAWQRQGLAPPQVVTAATEDYLESQDLLGEWIEACCDLQAQYWTGTTELFEIWKIWADLRDEFVGSVKSFSQRLEDSGRFKKKRDNTGARGFLGLRVKPMRAGAFARAWT